MQKKITYFVQDYEPSREAISKEVEVLSKSFNSRIFSIDTSSPISLLKTSRIPFVKSDIYHIYTSLGDRLFLPVVKKKPLVLTGAAPTKIEKIDKMVRHYEKVDRIVVESRQQMNSLIDLEVGAEKIRIIYPGIDLGKFRNFPLVKKERFKILFASAPMENWQMETRGIKLILGCAKSLPEMDFVMLWRKTGYDKLVKMIRKNRIRNIKVINRTVKDVRSFYREADCTIFPFLSFDREKQVPMAAIESLASARPVLVSDKIGISEIVRKEKCGLAFEPCQDSMICAIKKLHKNYGSLQKNSRKAAEKYFSKEDFLGHYRKLYSEL